MKVIKYTCPACNLEVWTRQIPKVSLTCNDCYLAGIVASQSENSGGLYNGPWPVLVPAVLAKDEQTEAYEPEQQEIKFVPSWVPTYG